MARKKIDNTQENSEFQKLLENDNRLKTLPKIGDIVKGTVISGNKKEVYLDFDGLMTGLVRGKELYNESADFANLQSGDEVEATVLELENEMGLLELSFRFAGHQKTWSTLQKLKEENKNIEAKILDANKGGLLVSVNNVHGFLPVSQLSPEFYPRVQGGDKNKILERLKSYVGQTFNVKVLDLDADSEKLIVSEKASWEENQKDTLGQFKVGDIVDGTITAVTDFGVFVEFGTKLEGLIHISELAWQRIDDPADLFKVGDLIKAEIIKIEGSKIFLSSKKLKEDPWVNINKKYKIGDMVEGKVLKVKPFGLFVQLDDDIHGLAHISELSDKKIASIDGFAKPGSTMEFKIVSIEPNEHRLGLSLKTTSETSDKEVAEVSATTEEASPAVKEKKPKAKKEEKAE
ncbi:MAG: S1 RNA-binding domain-containing protein [Patescibacteria group bacterium]